MLIATKYWYYMYTFKIMHKPTEILETDNR